MRNRRSNPVSPNRTADVPPTRHRHRHRRTRRRRRQHPCVRLRRSTLPTTPEGDSAIDIDHDFDNFDVDHYPTLDVTGHHHVLVKHSDCSFVIVNNDYAGAADNTLWRALDPAPHIAALERFVDHVRAARAADNEVTDGDRDR